MARRDCSERRRLRLRRSSVYRMPRALSSLEVLMAATYVGPVAAAPLSGLKAFLSSCPFCCVFWPSCTCVGGGGRRTEGFIHRSCDRVDPEPPTVQYLMGSAAPHLTVAPSSSTTTMPQCHRCKEALPADARKIGQHRRCCKKATRAATVSEALRRERERDLRKARKHCTAKLDRQNAQNVSFLCLILETLLTSY